MSKITTKQKFENISNFPELYDLLYSEYYEDLDYYIKATKNYREILELGVGTGRIALQLAKLGKIVYGIDYSEKMLNVFKKKLSKEKKEVQSRVHLTNSNMSRFRLNRKFEYVYIPFMTFNYLLSLDAQRECLNCIYSHLLSDGILTMELVSMNPEWFLDDKLPRLIFRDEDKKEKSIVDIYRICRFDASSQIMEHDRIYKFFNDKGDLVSEKVLFLKNRFMFLGEITILLELTGFKIISVIGSYKGTEYSKESRVMIITASKNKNDINKR